MLRPLRSKWRNQCGLPLCRNVRLFWFCRLGSSLSYHRQLSILRSWYRSQRNGYRGSPLFRLHLAALCNRLRDWITGRWSLVVHYCCRPYYLKLFRIFPKLRRYRRSCQQSGILNLCRFLQWCMKRSCCAFHPSAISAQRSYWSPSSRVAKLRLHGL